MMRKLCTASECPITLFDSCCLFFFLSKEFVFFVQALVVITDGKQTTSKPYTKLSLASQGLKNAGIAVYAVGVGKGADAAELREIASSQEKVFISASFNELHTLAVDIRKRLCEGQYRNYFV